MNKRKIALLAMSACMIAILAIGGTLAYFTDTDEATNTLTMGNVQIDQLEWERVFDDEGNVTGIKEFTQDKPLAPTHLANLDTSTTYTKDDYTFKMRTGDTYVDKMVTVKNTGNLPAYVRTIIAIPSLGHDADGNAANNVLHWNYISDTDTTKNNGWHWGANKEEWPDEGIAADEVRGVTIDGIEYDLFIATNKNEIAAGEETAPSLTGLYLDPRVNVEVTPATTAGGETGVKYTFTWEDGTVEDLGDISTLKVLVFTQATQTDGFTNAWEALDAAFGDITEKNHPWAE